MDQEQLVIFEYDSIENDLASDLKAVAERIRLRLKKTAEDIIEIGKDLLMVKERLEYGQFTLWLRSEFDVTERSARNFMNAAKVFQDRTETVSVLSPKALYELASPSTLETVRKEVLDRLDRGELIRAKEIQELKRQSATERKKREEAERQAMTLLGNVQKYQAQIQELDQEIARYRSRPPHVVEKEVLPDGYRSIDSAIKDLESKREKLEASVDKEKKTLQALEASSERQKILQNRLRKLKRLNDQLVVLNHELETDRLLTFISSDTEDIKNEMRTLAYTCEDLFQSIVKHLEHPRSNIIEIPAETISQ